MIGHFFGILLGAALLAASLFIIFREWHYLTTNQIAAIIGIAFAMALLTYHITQLINQFALRSTRADTKATIKSIALRLEGLDEKLYTIELDQNKFVMVAPDGTRNTMSLSSEGFSVAERTIHQASVKNNPHKKSDGS